MAADLKGSARPEGAKGCKDFYKLQSLSSRSNPRIPSKEFEEVIRHLTIEIVDYMSLSK